MIIKEILGGGLTTPMLEWLQVEHVDCDHYCNTLYLGGGVVSQPQCWDGYKSGHADIEKL